MVKQVKKETKIKAATKTAAKKPATKKAATKKLTEPLKKKVKAVKKEPKLKPGLSNEVAVSPVTEVAVVAEPGALTSQQQGWWNLLKDIKVNYFGLPNQTVFNICKPFNIEPDKLYLKLNASAALVSLEEVLNSLVGKDRKPLFVFEPVDKYAVIKPNKTLNLF